MLTSEDEMRNFLSCSLSDDSVRWKHPTIPLPLFLKQNSQMLLQYTLWVRRTAWLILILANSRIPKEATQSKITSTTNPTLHVLICNMNIHSDKPASNCLRYVTACLSLQCSILRWGNVSATYWLCLIFLGNNAKSMLQSQIQ